MPNSKNQTNNFASPHFQRMTWAMTVLFLNSSHGLPGKNIRLTQIKFSVSENKKQLGLRLEFGFFLIFPPEDFANFARNLSRKALKGLREMLGTLLAPT